MLLFPWWILTASGDIVRKPVNVSRINHPHMLGAFQIMWNIKSWRGYTRELVWMSKRWYILCLGVKCKRDTTSFSRNLFSKIEALQVDICRYVPVGTSNAFYINMIYSIYVVYMIYMTDSFDFETEKPQVFMRHNIYVFHLSIPEAEFLEAKIWRLLSTRSALVSVWLVAVVRRRKFSSERIASGNIMTHGVY